MHVPCQIAPTLVVDTVNHGLFDLASEMSERITLIYFYQGLRCPNCIAYLKELERLTPEFAERGITTIAISSDTEARARVMQRKIAANSLRIGYGFLLSEARKWGLTISTSRGELSIGIEDLEIFFESGLFLLHAGRIIYYRSDQSVPLARPDSEELWRTLDFAIENR